MDNSPWTALGSVRVSKRTLMRRYLGEGGGGLISLFIRCYQRVRLNADLFEPYTWERGVGYAHRREASGHIAMWLREKNTLHALHGLR